MATVYQSGNMIPTHNCKITGAVSVLLENPDEIIDFSSLCILAPRIPENPIESVYKAISDPKLDLTKWGEWLETKRRNKDDIRLTNNVTTSSLLPNLNGDYYGIDSDINF